MPKNPENSKEKMRRKKRNPDLPNQDDGIQDCREEVKDKVSFVDFEARIIDEQIAIITQNPEVSEHLNVARKYSALPSSLGLCERMVLETYSAPPYVTPAVYKNEDDIKKFYEFLPIKPGLFPDALFEHLFDIKFKKPRNTVEGAEERKPYYPILRRLLSTLQPVSFKPAGKGHKVQSNRIFVITDPEFHGILISRVPDKQKINNYYPDVYAAIRSQEHMVKQYTDGHFGEMDSLKQMRYQVKGIIADLQNWKDMPQEKKLEIQDRIARLEKLLKLDINPHKKKAREQFETAKTLKDKQIDRVNPSSTSARLVGSFNELERRTAVISGITNHIGPDLDLFERIKDSMEITFNNARSYLSSVTCRGYFKPIQDPFVSAEEIKNGAKRTNLDLYDDSKGTPRGMTVGLRAIEENKGTPTPFREWAGAVLSHLRVVYKLNRYIAAGKINESEIKTVHNEVIKHANLAQEALGCQKIHRIFAETLEDILKNPERARAPWMLEKFCQLFDETSNKQLKAAIRDLLDLVDDWQAEVLNLISGDNPELVEEKMEESNQIYREKVYELMKSFDFMGLITSLTVQA